MTVWRRPGPTSLGLRPITRATPFLSTSGEAGKAGILQKTEWSEKYPTHRLTPSLPAYANQSLAGVAEMTYAPPKNVVPSFLRGICLATVGLNPTSCPNRRISGAGNPATSYYRSSPHMVARLSARGSSPAIESASSNLAAATILGAGKRRKIGNWARRSPQAPGASTLHFYHEGGLI